MQRLPFNFFFFFELCNICLSSAEEKRRTELQWPIHRKTAPTYHPTQGCTVEHVVQLGKQVRTQTHTHTSLRITQWTHTSVGLRAVALLGTGLHVIAKQTWVQCPPAEEGCSAVSLQQQQCVFPRPFLSHHVIGVRVNDWYFTQAKTVTDLSKPYYRAEAILTFKP